MSSIPDHPKFGPKVVGETGPLRRNRREYQTTLVQGAPPAAWLPAQFDNYRQNWRYSGIRNVLAYDKARLLLNHDGGERLFFGESPVMANRKMKQKNCEQKKRWEANAQNPNVMSWLVRERQGTADDSPDPWIKTSPL